MDYTNLPVQMLCICNADGSIAPIRFRFENEEHQLQTIKITQVLSTNEVKYVGIEALVYLCKAALGTQEKLFELRYSIRSHKWILLRVIY